MFATYKIVDLAINPKSVFVFIIVIFQAYDKIVLSLTFEHVMVVWCCGYRKVYLGKQQMDEKVKEIK